MYRLQMYRVQSTPVHCTVQYDLRLVHDTGNDARYCTTVHTIHDTPASQRQEYYYRSILYTV
jgi:hypothetical protein